MATPNDDRPAGEGRRARIREICRDCLERWAAGETITESELTATHPDLLPELSAELAKVRRIAAGGEAAVDQAGENDADHAADDLPALLDVESKIVGPSLARGDSVTGGLQVRCPHCRDSVETNDEGPWTDVTCGGCGESFSLVTPPAESADSTTSVGQFELVKVVGMGSFGTVWMARDSQLDRIVAVKIPRRGMLTSQEQEFFFREARVAAQLSHPHIVSVHEAGREGDTLYIVSDFVQGCPLSEWLDGKRPSYREAAELCATLADALHHAHEAGVVHRDLKPANILIDSQGTPHITDFGLAKREAGEVTMTVDGQLLGTPSYMSPEQARGEAHQSDRRTDIYSLGVVLFQLLTGEVPFRGSFTTLVRQHLEDDPPSPRKLDPRVPIDLATICLKCLAKSPDARFLTAADLAAELRRHLAGQPINSRPVSRAGRVWKWCKRHPAAAVALGLLSLIAVVSPLIAAREAALRRQLSQFYGVWGSELDRNAARQPNVGHGQPESDAIRESILRLASQYYGPRAREMLGNDRVPLVDRAKAAFGLARMASTTDSLPEEATLQLVTQCRATYEALVNADQSGHLKISAAFLAEGSDALADLLTAAGNHEEAAILRREALRRRRVAVAQQPELALTHIALVDQLARTVRRQDDDAEAASGEFMERTAELRATLEPLWPHDPTEFYELTRWLTNQGPPQFGGTNAE